MKLERFLAQRCQREYVCLTRSGSAAIIVALNCLFDKSQGGEVIMPAVACPQIMTSITMAGFNPVFADLATDDVNPSLHEIQEVTTVRTRALLLVHAYGQPANLSSILSWAKKMEIPVIEDFCLALGGCYKGAPLGSFGDFSLVSFGYDKIVDAGGGGALLTSDPELAKRMDSVLARYPFLAEITAQQRAHVQASWSELDMVLEKRRENALFYEKYLNPEKVKLFTNTEGSVPWRYTCLYKGNRDALLQRGRNSDAIITRHYPNLAEFKTSAPLINSVCFSGQVINLFVRPETERLQMQKLVNTVNE